MSHILDNPILNALLTGNKKFAHGSEKAKYFEREVALFAGLKSNSKSDLADLHALVPEKSLIVLFTPKEIPIPSSWNIELKKEILQMVYHPKVQPETKDDELVPLKKKDVPAMLELATLTNPGPFLSRTIEFGNYQGIFIDGALVAMAGQRLQPDPYTEVSAVCTHPDHTGRGYAAKLVLSQISRITAAGRTAFLHVYSDNTAAIKLYEKLGFQIRKQMLVYALEKRAK